MKTDFNPSYIHNNFSARRIKQPKTVISRQATEDVFAPYELSDKVKALVKKSHTLIEDTWAQIRKKEIDLVSPSFTQIINNKEASLFPVYNGHNRHIVLQVKENKDTHRICVDNLAKDFTYEKIINTDFGSATVCSYNSKTSPKSDTTTKLVNTFLEENLPKLVR